MHELLNPRDRGTKMTLTDQDIIVDLGIRRWNGKQEAALIGSGAVRVPKGTPAGYIGSLLHKDFIGDLYRAKRYPAALEQSGRKELIPELQSIADELLKDPARFVDIMRDKRKFLQTHYTTCMQEIENDGHRFGEDLPDEDKKALTAFLATL
jgi:hypothetical protein